MKETSRMKVSHVLHCEMAADDQIWRDSRKSTINCILVKRLQRLHLEGKEER